MKKISFILLIIFLIFFLSVVAKAQEVICVKGEIHSEGTCGDENGYQCKPNQRTTWVLTGNMVGTLCATSVECGDDDSCVQGDVYVPCKDNPTNACCQDYYNNNFPCGSADGTCGSGCSVRGYWGGSWCQYECNGKCPNGCTPTTSGGTCTASCTECTNDEECICENGGGEEEEEEEEEEEILSLACTDLTRNPTATLNIGNQVNFTCSHRLQNVEFNHYNYRYNIDAGAWEAPSGWQNIQGQTPSFTITQAGNYIVQCQVCSSSDNSHCTTWAQAGGWSP